jgi:seryl-tRNA synthetase
MLDINLIRENPEWVQQRLKDKQFDVDFTEFIARDVNRRELIFQTEQLKAEKNKTSAAIPQQKKAGQDVS